MEGEGPGKSGDEAPADAGVRAAPSTAPPRRAAVPPDPGFDEPRTVPSRPPPQGVSGAATMDGAGKGQGRPSGKASLTPAGTALAPLADVPRPDRGSRVYEDRNSSRQYLDAVTMVNDYLRRLGQELAVTFEPLDEDGYTEVLRGSAQVGVNVLEEHNTLLLLSRIMEVPKDARATLYRRLLELNFLVTSDAAFAIDKDRDAVYLRAHRRLGGLDYEEFADLLGKVTAIADEWDDRLHELFPQDD
ncbi:MAG: CesT family type III secretion system chaperone [Myxococcota bacterium]